MFQFSSFLKRHDNAILTNQFFVQLFFIKCTHWRARALLPVGFIGWRHD